MGQKEPPKLGSTICYGQELAIRFVTAKSWPEKATKTRQYDLLRPRVGEKKASETRQYDLLLPRVGQKEPPRLGSTICYGQTWARKSHQDSAVRFVTTKSWPEGATKTRQYDLLRPNVGQKKPPRLGNTICYSQELARKSHQHFAVRFVTANSKSHQDSAARKSHQDSAVQFVTAKRGPDKATETRQYDLLRPNVGQKKPARLGSTIFVTAKSWPERATKTRQYDQTWARKSHQNSAVRFVTAKSWPERATKTRQYDLLQPIVGGNTICYGQTWARRSH